MGSRGRFFNFIIDSCCGSWIEESGSHGFRSTPKPSLPSFIRTAFVDSLLCSRLRIGQGASIDSEQLRRLSSYVCQNYRRLSLILDKFCWLRFEMTRKFELVHMQNIDRRRCVLSLFCSSLSCWELPHRFCTASAWVSTGLPRLFLSNLFSTGSPWAVRLGSLQRLPGFRRVSSYFLAVFPSQPFIFINFSP